MQNSSTNSTTTGNRKLPVAALVCLAALGLIKLMAKQVIGNGLYLNLANGLLLFTLLHLLFTLVVRREHEGWHYWLLRIKQINFQLGLLTGTLFFIEFIFQVLLVINRPQQTFDGEFTQPSDIVGWAPWAGHSGRSVMVAHGDTVYNVAYSFDSAGRRIYAEPGSHPYKMHSLFIGCSVTLGEGLPADATFAAQLTALDSNIHSYNYGMRGWGPHQTLFLFNRLTRINTTTVKEDTGVCIYTYIDPHLSRVYGGLRYLQWGSSSPEVWVDKNGALQYQLRSSFMFRELKLLSASATLRYFNIDYPNRFDDAFYKRFAAIVNYNAKEYYRLFPKGRFYIAMYPGIATDTTWLKYLNSTITVLQFPELEQQLKQENSAYRMKTDGHPTREAYKLFIEKIYSRVFK